MIEKIWKNVIGFEGLYLVSNYGEVKSLPKGNGNGNRERLLKQEKTNNGYMRVSLCKKGKVTRSSVHRLVAMAFLSNIENKEQVNHIDGVKGNNHVDNLEWATPQENTTHAIENKLSNVSLSSSNGGKIGGLTNRKKSNDINQKRIGKAFGGLMLLELRNPNEVGKKRGVFQCIHCGTKTESVISKVTTRKPYGCKSCSSKNGQRKIKR